MIDELELRTRFPEIPWDQPVELQILRDGKRLDEATITVQVGGESSQIHIHYLSLWACRYCIAMHGVSAQEVLAGKRLGVFETRPEALDHIEREHHD